MTSVEAELNTELMRAHHRRQQRGDHQAHQSGRQQIDDQRGIGDVAVGLRRCGRTEQIAVERDRDQAGQHQHEDRQDLEEAGEDRARLGVPFILRGEHALHDHLVGAPVPDAENRRAEENPVQGKSGSLIGLIMWK